MNNTVEPPSPSKIPKFFVPIFGISLGILLLILLIIILSYLFSYKRLPPHPSDRSSDSDSDADDTVNLELGLDEANLVFCPKLIYSQAEIEIRGKNVIPSTCAICLAEYAAEDVLRLLPDCEHLFHVDCVDPWLRRRPSCPICRKSLIPVEESAPVTRRREFFRSWFTPFMH